MQLLAENQQECPQWLSSMAMYGGGGGGGGGNRRPRGGGRGNRNFGARDFRKDGGGGGGGTPETSIPCFDSCVRYFKLREREKCVKSRKASKHLCLAH